MYIYIYILLLIDLPYVVGRHVAGNQAKTPMPLFDTALRMHATKLCASRRLRAVRAQPS